MRSLLKVRQRGDTIVEVMLAMAVVGMVLGVAYGIANRSVTIGRSAQERSEALKFAETQIELMKEYAIETERSPGDSVMDNLADHLSLSDTSDTDSACFTVDGAGDITIQKIENTLDPANADNACKFGGLYQVSVACFSGLPNTNSNIIAKNKTCGSSGPVAVSERKIVVRVLWERLGGGLTVDEDGNEVPVKDSLDVYYRYGG